MYRGTSFRRHYNIFYCFFFSHEIHFDYSKQNGILTKAKARNQFPKFPLQHPIPQQLFPPPIYQQENPKLTTYKRKFMCLLLVICQNFKNGLKMSNICLHGTRILVFEGRHQTILNPTRYFSYIANDFLSIVVCIPLEERKREVVLHGASQTCGSS